MNTNKKNNIRKEYSQEEYHTKRIITRRIPSKRIMSGILWDVILLVWYSSWDYSFGVILIAGILFVSIWLKVFFCLLFNQMVFNLWYSFRWYFFFQTGLSNFNGPFISWRITTKRIPSKGILDSRIPTKRIIYQKNTRH